jgi:hypothetical protein
MSYITRSSFVTNISPQLLHRGKSVNCEIVSQPNSTLQSDMPCFTHNIGEFIGDELFGHGA